MKVVQTNTTAVSAKKNIPFFNKESEGNFFHSSGKEQPFFSSPKNSFFKAQNTIQTKLTVGEPNDIYEKEADAMADKVMRMPANEQLFFAPKPLSISSVQRKCQHCEEEEKKMQRKKANTGETIANATTENYISSLNGKGKPLTKEERTFFEPRFVCDFSERYKRN